jgi:hypothetical protein
MGFPSPARAKNGGQPRMRNCGWQFEECPEAFNRTVPGAWRGVAGGPATCTIRQPLVPCERCLVPGDELQVTSDKRQVTSKG